MPTKTRLLRVPKSRRTITLPNVLLEKIRERAKKYALSENAIIEQCLRADFGMGGMAVTDGTAEK